MNTDKSSTHQHSVSGKPTTNTGVHSHGLTATDARIAALEAQMANVIPRITKLETSQPPPLPPIEPPPGTKKSIRATSIPSILVALADDTVDEIVVANGTYAVTGAGFQAANSLWIGSKFVARTRPVVVKAETTGGVTFNGGGSTSFGGISFEEGAHHQTWQGFVFANGRPTDTGVIMFGGYASAAPHHITLRDIAIAGSVTSPSVGANDHGVYFSQAPSGVHDILIDGLTVDGSGGLDTALHFYHSAPGNPNAWNVTVRRLAVTGTAQAIMFWDSTIHGIVIEDSTISGATTYGISYEHGGTVTLRRVTSTSSGSAGFYSSIGANPPGVTFESCDLR